MYLAQLYDTGYKWSYRSEMGYKKSFQILALVTVLGSANSEIDEQQLPPKQQNIQGIGPD